MYLADNTFSVMMHHGIFIKIYNGILGWIANTGMFSQKFEIEKFLSKIPPIIPHIPSIIDVIPIFYKNGAEISIYD